MVKCIRYILKKLNQQKPHKKNDHEMKTVTACEMKYASLRGQIYKAFLVTNPQVGQININPWVLRIFIQWAILRKTAKD